MREEMNQRESELSEAALSGVGGGEKVDPQLAGAARATLCRNCQKAFHSKSTCTHGDDLQRYIEAQGINSVHSYVNCPFRNR